MHHVGFKPALTGVGFVVAGTVVALAGQQPTGRLVTALGFLLVLISGFRAYRALETESDVQLFQRDAQLVVSHTELADAREELKIRNLLRNAHEAEIAELKDKVRAGERRIAEFDYVAAPQFELEASIWLQETPQMGPRPKLSEWLLLVRVTNPGLSSRFTASVTTLSGHAATSAIRRRPVTEVESVLWRGKDSATVTIPTDQWSYLLVAQIVTKPPDVLRAGEAVIMFYGAPSEPGAEARKYGPFEPTQVEVTFLLIVTDIERSISVQKSYELRFDETLTRFEGITPCDPNAETA